MNHFTFQMLSLWLLLILIFGNLSLRATAENVTEVAPLTSKDIQKGFEEATKNIEANKAREETAIKEEIKAKFNTVKLEWFLTERKKKEAYIDRFFPQSWEYLSPFGPYVHYNYFLRDMAYSEARIDIVKNASIVAPYQGTIITSEILYAEKEHSPNNAKPEQFYYTITTPVTADFEYRDEKFILIRSNYSQTPSIKQGWPTEIVEKIKKNY